MPKRGWEKAILQCADPARARHYWDSLLTTSAATSLRHASEEQLQVLMALFSGSEYLGDLLLNHPDWVIHTLNPEFLKHPRPMQGLLRDVTQRLEPLLQQHDYAGALHHLRLFKQREMLRIAARDLARLGTTKELILEISDVADVCLDTVYEILWQQLTRRWGRPWHRDGNDDWQPTEFSLLGMGKLGGKELNFSSDVDVIFVYSDEGYLFTNRPRKTDAGKGMSNHQFFTRLAKEFISEVSRLTDDGMLYRVDVRLRPEGDNGPLVRSLQSYENYYAQWGQMWERLMLTKTRFIAGSPVLAAEFLETIQPFRYPRNLNERILKEIATNKLRIENEVLQAGEVERNVKLGRGGIREIEFIAQAYQILYAGKNPFLQSAQTLPALLKLIRYNLLTRSDVQDLTDAYCFLRDVEHRLQMENNLQTHVIPTARLDRERLAKLMGLDTLREFESKLHTHMSTVRSIYDRVLRIDIGPTNTSLPCDFDANEDNWKQLLEARSFKDVEHALHLMRIFVHGPGYVHVSARTAELAMELVPQLLSYCPLSKATNFQLPLPPEGKSLSDPDRVIARLASFIEAYGSRAMLYETWTHNPSLFELLLLLFDRSEYLAEIAIRTPDMVDDLQLSGRLRRSKTADEILKELHFGLDDEDQASWMRRYHQMEQMRIGLRDILGLADFEHSLKELTALADACLRYSLEVVEKQNGLKSSPFVIIALGKLGGSELNYGSDLDIIFVSKRPEQDGGSAQKYALEVLELISKPTELGFAFQTDTRLRPDGEKGLKVNSLTAYEDYFQRRADLWEIQAYTRCRIVAGDFALGKSFLKAAAKWTNFSDSNANVAAYSRDWKKQIAAMRQRIARERTPSGKEALAIKTGTGGLMDVEFIAQTLALENGWQEPNTLACLMRAKDEVKLNSDEAIRLIENYKVLRRIEAILRRWSFAGETVLPDDPAPQYRVAVRCGFSTTEEFLNCVSKSRKAIHESYTHLLPSD